MWVFTRCGFYSVVKKPESVPDELEVRARCRKDLEVLKTQTGVKCRIITNAGTDYPYRLRIKREIWAQFLAGEAMEIDYPNFKDEVLFAKIDGSRRRKHRHDVYFEVWKALLALSNKPVKNRHYSWRELDDTLQDDQGLIVDAPDSVYGLPGTKNLGRKSARRLRPSKSWRR